MSRIHKNIISAGVLISIVLFYVRYPMISYRIDLAKNSNILGIITPEQVESIQSSVNTTYVIIIMAAFFLTLLAMSLTMDSVEEERQAKNPDYTKNELKKKLATLQKLMDDGTLTETEYIDKRRDIIQKLEL